jgi:hypothetical protein
MTKSLERIYRKFIYLFPSFIYQLFCKMLDILLFKTYSANSNMHCARWKIFSRAWVWLDTGLDWQLDLLNTYRS